MTRPLRLQVENGVYHITARGNERRSIYRDAVDRERFLEVLAQTLERFSWRCLGFCLMSNHYHLLVRTLQPNPARGMRDLNGVYAQWFNRRYGRDGHLFQGRYRATLIETDEHFLSAVAYVVRNPIRAGMCERPGEWPWSSHARVLGQRPPGPLALDELLAHFANTGEAARVKYRELTEGLAVEAEFLDLACAVVGSDAFVRLHLQGIERSPEIEAAQLRLPRPPLDELLASASTIEAIASAYGHGYTMPAIARHLGLHPSTISRRLTRHRAQFKT